MKITILYDNCPGKVGLRTGWGFSALIETENSPPLFFDTGGIDPGHIGIIIIFHPHGDHSGGLSDILEIKSGAEICVLASSQARLPGRKVTIK